MLSPAHFAVGGAIGARIPPGLKWLALPAAIGSHYVLDAIPHFEHADVLGQVLHIPEATLHWSWVVPWMVVFAGTIAWILHRAVKCPHWKWWAFVVLCGALAAAPDIPSRTMSRQHPLRRFHNAMHAHHDWATTLQKAMAKESIRTAMEHDRVSGWFYFGIAAEVLVEVIVFALGMSVIFNAGRGIDESHPTRAGPTEAEEE